MAKVKIKKQHIAKGAPQKRSASEQAGRAEVRKYAIARAKERAKQR